MQLFLLPKSRNAHSLNINKSLQNAEMLYNIDGNVIKFSIITYSIFGLTFQERKKVVFIFLNSTRGKALSHFFPSSNTLCLFKEQYVNCIYLTRNMFYLIILSTHMLSKQCARLLGPHLCTREITDLVLNTALLLYYYY